MTVSVIVPVYNEEKYIDKALKSILNQLDKPDEVIVVDNNSTDKSIAIAKQYQKRLPLRIIEEKNQGICQARHRGFNEAKGDILIKLDADAIIEKDWIKKAKEIFFKFQNVVGYSSKFLFYDLRLLKKTSLPSSAYQSFFKLFFRHYILIGPCFAIRKSVWDIVKNKVCLDSKKIHEDIDLSFHIIKYGKIYLDKTSLVYISGRREKTNPYSFFVEYPIMLVRTIILHKFQISTIKKSNHNFI
ncbi:MAG: glycosyltransferase [Patescibacteria group bacterium]|nr:glycosyltransferase [Patescibacteria group bacterium]